MARVSIELPHHCYDILIEPGLLGRAGEEVRALASHERCSVLVDDNVRSLHGDALLASLATAGYSVVEGSVAAGEANKTLASVEHFYSVLLEERMERLSPVIALGGGVMGDMAGFVSATYLRGVPFVQCPTTLLAMVDSSVGGKTGVNVPQGKNLVGAFYQPIVVLIDPLVLRTLPERELRCGLAECIKHGVIRDETLFEYIRENMGAIQSLDPDTLVELVARNVGIKAAVVMEDEKERGVRAHLNFGHTFAHAIEVEVGYGRIQHGEAVGLGMLAAARTAAELSLCDQDIFLRLKDILTAAGLPTSAELPSDEPLAAAMALDKKVESGRVRFVLPTRMGTVEVRDDVPEACVRAGWDCIRA